MMECPAVDTYDLGLWQAFSEASELISILQHNPIYLKHPSEWTEDMTPAAFEYLSQYTLEFFLIRAPHIFDDFGALIDFLITTHNWGTVSGNPRLYEALASACTRYGRKCIEALATPDTPHKQIHLDARGHILHYLVRDFPRFLQRAADQNLIQRLAQNYAIPVSAFLYFPEQWLQQADWVSAPSRVPVLQHVVRHLRQGNYAQAMLAAQHFCSGSNDTKCREYASAVERLASEKCCQAAAGCAKWAAALVHGGHLPPPNAPDTHAADGRTLLEHFLDAALHGSKGFGHRVFYQAMDKFGYGKTVDTLPREWGDKIIRFMAQDIRRQTKGNSVDVLTRMYTSELWMVPPDGILQKSPSVATYVDLMRAFHEGMLYLLRADASLWGSHTDKAHALNKVMQSFSKNGYPLWAHNIPLNTPCCLRKDGSEATLGEVILSQYTEMVEAFIASIKQMASSGGAHEAGHGHEILRYAQAGSASLSGKLFVFSGTICTPLCEQLLRHVPDAKARLLDSLKQLEALLRAISTGTPPFSTVLVAHLEYAQQRQWEKVLHNTREAIEGRGET